MKRIIFTLLVIVSTFSLKAQVYVNETNDSIIWVDNVEHDFGVVQASDYAVKHIYKLKNLSKDTITIQKLWHPGGGAIFQSKNFVYWCEKISPNSFFEVEVEFNVEPREGFFYKTGSIATDKGLIIYLSIKGYVLDRTSHKLNYDYSIIKQKKIKDGTIFTYNLKFTNPIFDTFKIKYFVNNASILIKNDTISTILPNQNGEIIIEQIVKNDEKENSNLIVIMSNEWKQYYIDLNEKIILNFSSNTEKIKSKKKPKIKNNKKKIK